MMVRYYILFDNYEQGLALHDLLDDAGVTNRIAPAPAAARGRLCCGMSLLVEADAIDRARAVILETGAAIPMVEHVPAENRFNVREATCSREGYTGDVRCEGCGTTLVEGEIIPMIPHNLPNSCSCLARPFDSHFPQSVNEGIPLRIKISWWWVRPPMPERCPIRFCRTFRAVCMATVRWR
jgi:hypothetical protein